MNKKVFKEAQRLAFRNHSLTNVSEFRQYTNAIYFAIMWARKNDEKKTTSSTSQPQ